MDRNRIAWSVVLYLAIVFVGTYALFTYVVVVLVFVVFVTAFVAGLDYGLTKAVLGIFG